MYEWKIEENFLEIFDEKREMNKKKKKKTVWALLLFLICFKNSK